jgi:hypothetical protein
MAQATSIVLNDGQATPVAVTFAPESVTPALSSFADRSAGVSLGFRRLKVSNSFASSKSVINRARLDVELPVTQTVNGIVSQAMVLRAKLELLLPDGCTDQNRKDLFAFVKNSLSNALVLGALRDLDPLY